jgi:hypothetical protein
MNNQIVDFERKNLNILHSLPIGTNFITRFRLKISITEHQNYLRLALKTLKENRDI